MDITLANKLTQLFSTSVGTSYPCLIGEAKIATRNANGSDFSIIARTPADAAQSLALLASDNGLFQRGNFFAAPAPVTFAMDMRVAGDRDPALSSPRALNITFRNADEVGYVWMPGMVGLYKGPDLSTTIDVLDRANRRWDQVNFLYKQNGSHLRVVR